MSITAMKQALEALEEAHPKPYNESVVSHVEAIADLRTAIEAAEKQEPVTNEGWKEAAIAWTVCASIHQQWAKGKDAFYKTRQSDFNKHADHARSMLNTQAAPAAQRQPLTDEKIWLEYQRFWPFHPAEEPRLAKDIANFARAIEAAHGIKGEA